MLNQNFEQQPEGVPCIGQGYLTNVAPSEFQQFYEEKVPVSLKGSAFLDAYGSHVDTATEVQKDADYPVRQATLHPIYENFRVQSFRQALMSEDPSSATLMGELMFQVSLSNQILPKHSEDRMLMHEKSPSSHPR